MSKKYRRVMELVMVELEETLENTPIREYLKSLTDTKILEYMNWVFDECLGWALRGICLDCERERRSERLLPAGAGPIASTDERGRPIKRNNRRMTFADCELDECIARMDRLGLSIWDENRIYFEEAQRRTESWKAHGGDERNRPACALASANWEEIPDFMGFHTVKVK